ncbi:MAG: acyltransferase family protein [Pseudomonadota bacterium]
MQYRPEIDGLRALAVLPVIFFHAGYSLFSGGYAGVDIFFVVSGYLITSIIVSDLSDGTFSLLGFYERRIRRIAPALFLVVIATIVIAWFVLMPRDMKDFAQSIVAVVIYSSNFLFWAESGYFESAAELKPLLHTWSLAVEEQYYILFPVMMIVFWKWARHAIIVIFAIIGIASLALAQWGALNAPSAAFYLLPFRAWEILLGALAAMAMHKKSRPLMNPLLNQFASLAGLCMIGATVFLYDASTGFPGLPALLPTMGACLIIIAAHEGTLAQKILSQRWIVLVGLLSYSAYLWHQPLFAFSRYFLVEKLSLSFSVSLIALTFLLSYLSWRFVERPFRNQNFLSQKQVYGISSLLGGTLVAFGLYVNEEDGLPGRYDGEILKILSVEEGWQDNHACTFATDKELEKFEACTAQGRFVYLFGDSHAGAISKPLRAALEKQGISLVSWSMGGCLPVTGTTVLPQAANEECIAAKEQAFSYAMANPAPMILAARWRLHFDGTRYDNGEGGVELGSPMRSVIEETGEGDIYQFTAEKLSAIASGMPLIVVNQIPEAGWNVPSRVARFVMAGQAGEEVTTDYDLYLEKNMQVNAMLNRISGDVAIVKADELVCSKDTRRCVQFAEKKPLYRDEDHPSEAYGAMIADEIVETLTGMKD